MKTAQEIAQTVTVSPRWNTKMAVGAAQGTVLNALGITATCHAHAEAIFDKLGITVTSVRQGRRNVPEVYVSGGGGGFNRYGEGEAWDGPAVDLSAINEWIAE